MGGNTINMNLISKLHYLHAMEVPIWVKRNTADKSPSSVCTQPINSSLWENLQQQVKQCTLCPLHQTRTNAVFGMGNPASRLLFIGEGPGANEDRQGLPFVGRAGQLLDKMLAAINLDRNKAYIANVVKCRPPNNRDPQSEEIASCTPYLQQQIAFIKPALIVALGRVSAHYLLKTKTSMAQLRGKIHTLQPENIPLIVTYHPAYLLRNPIDKAQALKDLHFINNFLQKT